MSISQYVRFVFRRGTTAQIAAELASSAITKYEGEPRWDTTAKQLSVYDGSRNRRVHGLDMIVCADGAVVVNDGQVVWNGEFE